LEKPSQRPLRKRQTLLNIPYQKGWLPPSFSATM